MYVYSTGKGKEWKGRGQPGASSQPLHFPRNSSSRKQSNNGKNRKFNPRFTCVISRLVPAPCVPRLVPWKFSNLWSCMLSCCAHFSVCRGISPDGIQWCWTEGCVWVRPWPSLTGRGSWERGECGAQRCGQNKGSERWREQSRSYELKTGGSQKEIRLEGPVKPSLYKSCLLPQMMQCK